VSEQTIGQRCRQSALFGSIPEISVGFSAEARSL
jgi:hypothetical protein